MPAEQESPFFKIALLENAIEAQLLGSVLTQEHNYQISGIPSAMVFLLLYVLHPLLLVFPETVGVVTPPGVAGPEVENAAVGVDAPLGVAGPEADVVAVVVVEPGVVFVVDLQVSEPGVVFVAPLCC